MSSIKLPRPITIKVILISLSINYGFIFSSKLLFRGEYPDRYFELEIWYVLLAVICFGIPYYIFRNKSLDETTGFIAKPIILPRILVAIIVLILSLLNFDIDIRPSNYITIDDIGSAIDRTFFDPKLRESKHGQDKLAEKDIYYSEELQKWNVTGVYPIVESYMFHQTTLLDGYKPLFDNYEMTKNIFIRTFVWCPIAIYETLIATLIQAMGFMIYILLMLILKPTFFLEELKKYGYL